MAGAGRKALCVSHEPFNLSYTADEEAASSHKERPQRSYDSILYPKAATPTPPELQTGLFSLKERRGKTEEVPKMAYNVWEKEAADINLKLSQLGFTPGWGVPHG